MTDIGTEAASDRDGPGAVVVMGAASGIGEAISIRLADCGYQVFCVDLVESSGSDSFVSIRCDVTDNDSVDAMAEIVRNSGIPVAGIVNSAGIAGAGPLMDCSDDELLRNFQVNALGTFRVIKALFPALLESRGRIINITSLSGLFEFPFVGPYVMSKHAAEAMSICLRREFSHLGISVSTIAPGKVVTPLLDKARILGSEKLESISEHFRERAQRYSRYDAERTRTNAVPPERVADVTLHALTSRRPRRRYYPVRHPLRTRLFLRLSQRTLDRIMNRI